MKMNNLKKVMAGMLLALVMVSAAGCVVADRPYYYGSDRRYDYVRPYDRFWSNYWNRERARSHRDHDRWDRD